MAEIGRLEMGTARLAGRADRPVARPTTDRRPAAPPRPADPDRARSPERPTVSEERPPGRRVARQAGERPEVRERHFGLAHGIGRSGDVMAEQPKAAGSSVIVHLTRYLSLDAIRIAGIKAAKACCVLPTATGLTMTLVLLAQRQLRPAGKYVVWSRIGGVRHTSRQRRIRLGRKSGFVVLERPGWT